MFALHRRLCVLDRERYRLFEVLDKIKFFHVHEEYVPIIKVRLDKISEDWLLCYALLEGLKYGMRWFFYGEG